MHARAGVARELAVRERIRSAALREGAHGLFASYPKLATFERPARHDRRYQGEPLRARSRTLRSRAISLVAEVQRVLTAQAVKRTQRRAKHAAAVASLDMLIEATELGIRIIDVSHRIREINRIRSAEG